jgi:hypothetical protein
MEVPEDRTHGADSAINDTIPGSEVIPDNIPDSPHGDMSLEYSLQNFNALVSANTAMQGEVSSLNVIIADLRDRLKDNAHEIAGNEKAYNDLYVERGELKKELVALKQKHDNVVEDRNFAREQTAVLQRRLDRSLGYLDRVLDDEDGMRAPDTRAVPAEKPPVGPAIGEIPDAAMPSRRERNYSDAEIRPYSVATLSTPEFGRRRRF